MSLQGEVSPVDAYLSREAPCSVEIHGAVGRLIPDKTLARFIQTSVGPGGEYLLPVEFAQPLMTLKEPGKM